MLDLPGRSKSTFAVGPVEISAAEAPGSDRDALLFSVLPPDRSSHFPDRSPAGYRAEDEWRQAWTKTFSATLPYEPMADTPGGTELDGEWMIEGLAGPPCVRMTQPVSHALPGGVGPVGDSEDILDRARPSETEARLWRRLKAFDCAVDTANRKNLKPKKTPDPHGVKRWNEECTAARALVYHAPNGLPRHAGHACLETSQLALGRPPRDAA